MNQAAPAVSHGGHEHHEPGFLGKYVFSLDHKMIGRQFMFMCFTMMILGGALALLARWQLAWPDTQVPFMSWVPEPHMYEGHIDPAGYNSFFTMHATIMIFFVVMPILVGAFVNFLIPLMIGTRDMAFPFLNMRSVWVPVVACFLGLVSFCVPGQTSAGARWTAYRPLSADPTFSGVDLGQNVWCISLIVLGASSLMGSINYITTIINMRAPGM